VEALGDFVPLGDCVSDAVPVSLDVAEILGVADCELVSDAVLDWLGDWVKLADCVKVPVLDWLGDCVALGD